MRNKPPLLSVLYWSLIISSSVLMSCQEPATTEANPSFEDKISVADTAAVILPSVVHPDQDDRRAIWQKPEIVLKKLGPIGDKVIADIGAGSGYFAFRLLPTCQKVIAIDIDTEALTYMDSIAQLLPEEYKSHFETRLATPSDPKLMPLEADVILMVNTYLYINDRIDYLRQLKTLLPPNGQLLIIDYKKKIIPTGPEVKKRVSLSQAEQELLAAGFEIINSDDRSLDYQYVILARP